MSLSEHSEIAGIEGEGASAPFLSLPRDEREVLMRQELVTYFTTGIEPVIAPHDGVDDKSEKLLRCVNCGTLVWKSDKKELHDSHLGHQMVVAAGGTVQEALMLKYNLIRSEEDDG